jgi:hypothetical protein
MYARDFFEQKILGLANGTSILANTTGFYVALLLSNPGDNGSYTEIGYTGYARQQINFTEPAAATGAHSIQNSEIITFPESTETAGTVTHIGIFDSPNVNTGNMWLYGELDDAISVISGVSPIFQIGSIKYTLSGKMSSTWRARILNILRGNGCTGFTPYFGCANGDVESGGSEFSGNGYARVAIPFTTPANLDSGAMAIHNNAAIVTPYATAQWGTWSHTVVYDAPTGGNPFYLSARAQSNVIYKGGACGYDEGDLILTIN